MTSKDNRLEQAAELRRLAEEINRRDGSQLPEDLESLSSEKIQQMLHELRVHQIELTMQNEELRTAQEELDAERARYFDLYDLAPGGYCTVSESGLILETNLTAAALLGIARGTMIGQLLTRFILQEDQDICYLLYKKLCETPSANSGQADTPQECELRMVKMDGTAFWAHLTAVVARAPSTRSGQDSGGAHAYRIMLSDITERKRVEAYKEIGREILHILNEPGDMQDAKIQRVLAVLKMQTGFDAVGIRLQEGDDFPYFVQDGFSEAFLLTENTLIERAADGGVCRDKDGFIKLECTCGLVISGRTDPASPLFTPGGSCWTNDSFPLLDIPPSEDPRLHPRNNCIHQGYASVALVPIRAKDRIVGLIQLNDRRKGCFSLQIVELLEGIALHIGSALMRKRAEEALRESDRMLRDSQAVAHIGAYITHLTATDFGTNTWQASSEIYKIFGIDKDYPHTLAGWAGFIHPDSQEELFVYHQQVVRERKRFDHQYKIIRINDGAVRWVHGTGELEYDEKLNPIRMLGTIQDITERKRAEEENKRLQAQLQQAQKMEAIGTLAGGIAHDFNNILSAILGYAEMVQEDSPVGSRVRKDIDQVVNAGHRAKELVKQILAFSRQDATEHIPVQPAAIIKEALKMLRSSLPSTIDIRQDIDAEAGLVLADPTQIHQTLINLCTNAFHAMEETGGTLTISLKRIALSHDDLQGEPHVQPGRFMQLSVGDTGYGIASDIKEKIFDPYFTTKEIDKGTGMGLAIIHGIVESYQGFITCHSRPGEGTVFHVYLPIIPDTALSEIKSAAPDLTPVGNEHILYIDDEEILAEMGKTMLERLGYRVTARTSSLEALATFQNQPDQFDLVITDQTMPGMTGVDLARRMLQIRPGMPIILCTGFSTLITEDKAKSLGIKGFALKPLARKDIAALIRKVLEG